MVPSVRSKSFIIEIWIILIFMMMILIMILMMMLMMMIIKHGRERKSRFAYTDSFS